MKIINKQDYDKKITINDRDVKCYSKDKLEDLYPKGNYELVGETFERNKKKEIDRVTIAEKELIISEYGKHSKIFYKKKGFFEVGKNKYLVYLQNRFIFIILFFGILLLIIGMILFMWKLYNTTPTFSPDYPLPEVDKNAEVIKENDNKKNNNKTSKNNQATISLSKNANVYLSSKKIVMSYQNKNNSNKDAVLTLFVIKNNKEYMIARSGRIKVGRQIKNLTLNTEYINLKKGTYSGSYKIDFYDPDTGERATAATNFNDITIYVQ